VGNGDRNRSGSAPLGQGAEELALLRQPGDEPRDLTADYPERGHVLRQPDPEHVPHQDHHQLRRDDSMNRIATMLPRAVHYFVAFVALGEQLRDLLGRILQVTVGLDDPLAPRAQHARLDRRLLPEVAREPEHSHPRVRCADLAQ
jgi:hypothetical protein